MTIDTDWRTRYAALLRTPQEAVSAVRPGHRVFIGSGAAQPTVLVDALVARSEELVDTEIVHMLTLGRAPYADPRLQNSFRVNSFFVSQNVREAIWEGLGDYTPIYLSDIPRLFASGRLPIDVALIQVAPPDEQGRCSLGVSVDIVRSAVLNAKFVVAQVNENMPRTCGASTIEAYDIDVMVDASGDLLEMPSLEIDEIADQIGRYVAGLIEDGSTVEFGIGAISQAVMAYLHDKRDLGIHTEMFSDAMIDLVESGAVSGSRKSRDKGQIVASFCMGTKRLYDYVDGNERFAFHPTEYVNDPFVIASQNKQVAINTALQVDLTGQVCADSLGVKFYSGIGGQVDFARGAARSPGGKSIIALPSTAKEGTVSRITCTLDPGAGVVTTRGDVHYVVTEYGVAYLHGKSVQERAIALIAIAHPKFRAALTRQAVEARYLRPDYARIEGKIVVAPKEYDAVHIMDDGTLVTFRGMHPTDEPRLTELLHALSQETIYYRFMHQIRALAKKEIQDFVYVNHRTDVAIVATVPEAHGEAIIGIGRYYLDQTRNLAEVAFVVRDDWQNQGIGTALFRHLALVARRNGIAGFTAEVLRENKAMQQVIAKSAFDVQRKPNGNTYSYVIRFE